MNRINSLAANGLNRYFRAFKYSFSRAALSAFFVSAKAHTARDCSAPLPDNQIAENRPVMRIVSAELAARWRRRLSWPHGIWLAFWLAYPPPPVARCVALGYLRPPTSFTVLPN